MSVFDAVLGGAAPKPPMIAITAIRDDGGTQMRAELDDPTVFEYTQAMIQANGWGAFPPVIAYYDGSTYWLCDGFHRVQAYRDAFPASSDGIPCEVRAGTRRDAILYAAGANANHGVRRTQADKERAVETLLRDAEWTQWSDTEIARRCAVDPKTVGNHRRKLATNMEIPESTMRKGADGRTTNTAKNGRKPAPPAPSPEQHQYDSAVATLAVARAIQADADASQVAVATLSPAAAARLEAAGVPHPPPPNALPADLASRGWELRQVAGVGKWYGFNRSGPRSTDAHERAQDAIAAAYGMQRDLAWEAWGEPADEDAEGVQPEPADAGEADAFCNAVLALSNAATHLLWAHESLNHYHEDMQAGIMVLISDVQRMIKELQP